MKALFIDCPTGLAGDMLLASFLDLGVPKEVIEDPLFSIGLGKTFTLSVQEGQSNGLRGLRVDFKGLKKKSAPVRFQQIIEIVEAASWKRSLREKVLKVFQILAEAEAAVHGQTLEKVHFHELGSLDALIEVASVCAAVEYLKPLKVICSFPPAGSGMVEISHGCLSVPVPVVVELAKNHQIKLLSGENYPKAELTTPTGLALMAVLADDFGQPASLSIKAVGIGLGRRSFDRPNFLRICSLEEIQPFDLDNAHPVFQWQPLVFQESWIDDTSPEDLAILIAELRGAGAIEVISYSVQMKKGRQGVCVKAIVKPAEANKVRIAWFSKGTTIGLQEHIDGRWVLSRRRGFCSTSYGKIAAKQVRRPDGHLTIKPEHDELVRVSIENGISLEKIRHEVYISANNFVASEDWSW